MFERYYDGKAKEFSELNMGSMTYEEYMTKFLEFLRYVPHLKDENKKVQRFVSGFPVAFKDQIEYDEPRSLEEVIKMLKHCYEKLKHKFESTRDWKGNEKTKGKWAKKKERLQDASDKEIVASYKKFNVVDKGHGFQPEELNKGNGKKPLRCWNCGGEHHHSECPNIMMQSLIFTVLGRH